MLRHPAKFPESLARDFIEFFTRRGQTVLDPMVGTGSTVLACLASGRSGIGLELNPAYAELARRRLAEALPLQPHDGLRLEIHQADAARLAGLDLPPIDYVLTSRDWAALEGGVGSEGISDHRPIWAVVGSAKSGSVTALSTSQPATH